MGRSRPSAAAPGTGLRSLPSACIAGTLLAGGLLAVLAPPAAAQFFNGVYSRDGVDVVAAADSGALYRSVSGGVAWIRGSLGDKALRDVIARGASIVVVGDSGKIFRSVDLGGTWTVAVVEGAPSLRRVESLGGEVLMVVGGGGTVLVSGDWGATWSAQASGTTEQLNAVRFVDGQNGWIAGTNGFVARTTNGGGSWTPKVLGTTQHLNGVDASGTGVWVVGDNATAFRSVDGGDSFEQVNLHADAWPDVKAVWLQTESMVYITGGGGFIRRSVDGGATWTFQQHGLQGQISDLYFRGANGWAASSRQRVVLRTTDGGVTWNLPAGATTTRAWVSKLIVSATIRGSSISVNPVHKNTLYAAMGNQVYRTRDAGETWSYIATIALPSIAFTRTNAFVVSAKDSNYWVAAVQGSGATVDRVVWSDDAGATWNDAVARYFGEYGIPLEVDPDRPDTMYFGVDSDSLMRSIDRGKTWSEWSSTVFRSPCDIVVVPESDSSVILVGDGITSSGNGRYWRTTGNTGVFTTSGTVAGSEVPGMACARLRNANAFGTNWSGGGVQRSTDFGLIWPGVHTVGNAWGVDIAKDDPDCVVFGVYSGSAGYLSLTGGASGSFIQINSLPGSNYSFYARDRATILAEQSAGIYKLNVTQALPISAQSVAVMSPNGGESWAPGTLRDITWSTSNVVVARIEYQARATDPWQLVAEVEGSVGHHEWLVPYDATAEARIRVSDAWDASPSDVSNEVFTIPLALMSGPPASVGYGTHAIGTSTLSVVTVSNPGTAALTVHSIATKTGAFHAGRSSLSVPAGASDTVGVWFSPTAASSYMDQLTIEGNGYNAPTILVALYGTGMDTVEVDLTSPDGGEQWRYGTAQKIEWGSAQVSAVDLAYRMSAGGEWVTIAENVPDVEKSYVWVIPNTPSAECVVRVRQHGGTAEDVSKEAFSITAPILSTAPEALDVGTTSVGVALRAELTIGNGGTAPLTVSSLTSSDPRFWPGRTTLVVPVGASDTVGVYYQPTSPGYDNATLTVTADDAGSPHSVPVSGRAVVNVSVGGGGSVTSFAVWPNRPNPFAERTVIRYALPVGAAVSLEVFNMKGERVATLVNEEQGPGEYSVSFGPGGSGRGRQTLPAGIYFYRFRAGAFKATHRMVLMK